jgi:hypothetical protein
VSAAVLAGVLAAAAQAAPPNNDNFANAEVLAGSALSVSGTNVQSTEQTGDPTSYCEDAGCTSRLFPFAPRHTVWYRWVSPGSGQTTIDVCNTNADTALGVYTGSGLGSLTEVASNNNACLGGFGSKVTFAAAGGVTYHIDVDGLGGAPEGSFFLNLFGPPADPASPPEPGPAADTDAPDTEVTDGPTGRTKSKSASLAFTSSETGSTFECKLDAGPFEVCTSPKAYSGLTKGSHTFVVRAKDPAGNVDPTPASRSWTVKKKKKK